MSGLCLLNRLLPDSVGLFLALGIRNSLKVFFPSVLGPKSFWWTRLCPAPKHSFLGNFSTRKPNSSRTDPIFLSVLLKMSSSTLTLNRAHDVNISIRQWVEVLRSWMSEGMWNVVLPMAVNSHVHYDARSERPLALLSPVLTQGPEITLACDLDVPYLPHFWPFSNNKLCETTSFSLHVHLLVCIRGAHLTVWPFDIGRSFISFLCCLTSQVLICIYMFNKMYSKWMVFEY